jgi:hypothetical protein
LQSVIRNFPFARDPGANPIIFSADRRGDKCHAIEAQLVLG